MDISKYIYDYLVEYNTSVVVPDLGCFTISHKPSEIKGGVVVPPVKTVMFDSEKSEDDNVFALYIAKREDITHEQAVKEIKNFYNYFFLRRLALDRKPVVFEKFGTFSLSGSGNINFEPIDNFFKDNFGLGSTNISGEVKKQPQPVKAEPVKPVVAPVKPPESVKPAVAPVKPPEPAKPVVAPVKPPESVKPAVPVATAAIPAEPTKPVTVKFVPDPVQTQTQPEKVKPVDSVPKTEPKTSDDSLFNTGETVRFRENTERRRPPTVERFERSTPAPAPAPPKQPSPPPKQAPSKQQPSKPPPKPKKERSKSSGSAKKVIWLLLIAVLLGVGGYFGYPIAAPYITSLMKPTEVAEEPAAMPESVYDDEMYDPEPIDDEFSQTLDDSTDIRNALSLDDNRQQETTPVQESEPQSQPQTQPQQPQSITPVATAPVSQPQSSGIGQGRFVVVVGSFTTRQAAENYMTRMQSDGFNCEIVDAGNQRFRVSIASFDNWTEAQRHSEQMSSRFNGEIWATRR